MKTVYDKLDLVSGADENGRYWEIQRSSKGSVGPLGGGELRESDMVELANWIAAELGWINRNAGKRG